MEAAEREKCSATAAAIFTKIQRWGVFREGVKGHVPCWEGLHSMLMPTEVKSLLTEVSTAFQMRGCLGAQGMSKGRCDVKGKGFGGSPIFV